MTNTERDTVYSNDGTNRTVYSRESSSTGWFVGIIVALALLAIGYLVFSANSGPSDLEVAAKAEAQKGPVIFGPLLGSTVVGTNGAALILQAQDGTCTSMDRTNEWAMWYARTVDCPTATVEPAVETPTPAAEVTTPAT